MTLVGTARAVPASKLSLEQDNTEGFHLVGVLAPAIVYRAVLRSGEGEVAASLNWRLSRVEIETDRGATSLVCQQPYLIIAGSRPCVSTGDTLCG